MKSSLLNVLLFFILLCLPMKAEEENPNNYCFRCHSMENLSIKADHSGLVKNFTITPEDFELAGHSDFYCTDCHSEQFEQYPHPEKVKGEFIECLDCHEDDPDPNFIQFEKIDAAFKESIHYTKLGDNFTCFNCHDPHTFHITSRVSEDIKETVLYDNHICMDCHNDQDRISLMTQRVFPGLQTTHDWLPHQNLHWSAVRCIDCHTDPEQPGVSHLILPKEEAVKNCVECHSTDSRLTHTLYKFQAREERSETGFFNQVILNDSYVVGSTRNYYLNLLSFILFGLTLAGLSIHGFFYAGAIRRRPSEKTSDRSVHKEYFYPLWLRFWHWLNAIVFFSLITSGLTLQYASDDNWWMSFSTAITVHNISGITLSVNYLLFFIGNIITGNYKQYIPALQGLFNRLFLQAKFYLIGIFKNNPHPFETSKKRKFNPLQQLTYLKIMYVLMPIIVITGWALLFPETIIEEVFGISGLFLTAMLHTVTGFVLSLFMFGHIYLGTTGKTITSNFKSMFTGWHETEHH